MAITFLTYRKFDEAVAEAERAVELEPGSADMLNWSGVVRCYAGPQELAIEQSRESIRLNPRDPQIYGRYQALTGAYFALGRYREALDAAGRVQRLRAEWIEAHTFIIASLAELDRLDEAQAALAAVRRLQPRYSVAYATRRHPYRDPEINSRLAAALRKAGVE
jgi:tetratricopeptide (TPR) repeat protein